jgi:F420-non-reducing hydrogenase iron-sulfur subunit
LRKLLGYAGIDPARLLLDWVSGSEANRFAQVVQEFTEVVRRLGPLETKKAAAPGAKARGALE